ncbi:MAG: DUF4167 domain-containing protein [Alphaproteobacteria bacterium]|nr:DUF4167 domain-containing protein [Alphaproteobacteria bacterium]MBU1515439.1 DUF4167 domain-containing protein [Alphaproteobacteria bacterium]MBU2095437.1 DUF4167 domain-containing protein [Alphaproteobacteria bacterium]MBU2150679.1 DUF4167 domain-containing protein [Alphaproteobacteria bacterium]MBU2306943.1 DUF4167 domain-containing protein [Alphaproteobacteria bacterium]
MRDFKGMKRQRGRNRGSSGGSGGGGGNKPQPHNANRAFDSNGPDGVKVRGNAQHVFEKYQQLARDAGSAGDRVLAENYLQHAEHYFRLLRALQPTRPASEIIGRDQFASGYDIDFEDETGRAQSIAADEAAATAEANGEAREAREAREREDAGQTGGDQGQNQNQNRPREREWQPRDDRPRDQNRNDGANRDRNRDWQPRENRDRNRDRPRDDRPRDEQPREDRPRDDRPRDDRTQRDDRPNTEAPRADAPRAEGEGRRERSSRQDRDDRPRDRDRDRPARDPLAVVQPQGDPAPEERGHMLRDAEGGASHAPAFLQAAAPRPIPAADTGEEKPKARRRRAPRTFEGDAAPAPAESSED